MQTVAFDCPLRTGADFILLRAGYQLQDGTHTYTAKNRQDSVTIGDDAGCIDAPDCMPAGGARGVEYKDETLRERRIYPLWFFRG